MLGFHSLTHTWKLTWVAFPKAFRRMFSTEIVREAKNIFEYSVKAVQPEELIRKSVLVQSNRVEIQGKCFFVNRNVHIVGFGKAVLGMALELENLLQDHVISGVLSVPAGMQINSQRFNSRLEVLEGAKNNIPDNDSFLAANKIAKLVTLLGESSLLFVLISGGGSALLPYPKCPLNLEEKQSVIKVLASRGATIEELNTVRKRLSILKGGGLAKLAKPAQTISLILSDIIGDPLSFIASGPTVENTDDPFLPLAILEKYNIKDSLPVTAIKLLEDASEENKSQYEKFDFVNNFIIGNNTIALNAAANKAAEFQYDVVIMTSKLCGIASNVGCKIVQLVDAALQQNDYEARQICEGLNIENEKVNCLLKHAKEFEAKYKGLCVLFGGETTVEVKGKGVGGRNQELALASSVELCNKKSKNDIVLLSAGTDGIDGPTDAAGAIATPFIVDMAQLEGTNALNYLEDNNSYNFYHSLNNGLWHVNIGHTGTNVMDIIVVLIKRKE